MMNTEGEAYDAERHLLLGTPASAPVLAQLHYVWYKEDSPHLAALYASRSVLPYLVLGNLASATSSLAQFTSQLTTSNPSLLTQSIDSSKSSARIFPSLPLLNFLAMLILACQKGDSGLFRQLAKHYATHLKETDELWTESLANIGEIWFGIKIPKQGNNPLFDMMSNMMFGGAGMGGGGGQKQATPRSGTPKPKIEGSKAGSGTGTGTATPSATAPAAAPPTMDLD
jgi:golgi to ER traffic protein 4